MSAEKKEQRTAPEKPWVILIERVRETGEGQIVEYETSSMRQLNSTAAEFLENERADLHRRIENLQQSVAKASQEQKHGQDKPKREVTEDRKNLNKEIGKALDYTEVLSGKGKRPIVVRIENDEPVNWGFPRGSEDLWTQYIRDEKSEILDLPLADREIIHRTFVLRHQISQGVPDAKQEYYRFIEDVVKPKKKDYELQDYFIELRDRFS